MIHDFKKVQLNSKTNDKKCSKVQKVFFWGGMGRGKKLNLFTKADRSTNMNMERLSFFGPIINKFFFGGGVGVPNLIPCIVSLNMNFPTGDADKSQSTVGNLKSDHFYQATPAWCIDKDSIPQIY